MLLLIFMREALAPFFEHIGNVARRLMRLVHGPVFSDCLPLFFGQPPVYPGSLGGTVFVRIDLHVFNLNSGARRCRSPQPAPKEKFNQPYDGKKNSPRDDRYGRIGPLQRHKIGSLCRAGSAM